MPSVSIQRPQSGEPSAHLSHISRKRTGPSPERNQRSRRSVPRSGPSAHCSRPGAQCSGPSQEISPPSVNRSSRRPAVRRGPGAFRFLASINLWLGGRNPRA